MKLEKLLEGIKVKNDIDKYSDIEIHCISACSQDDLTNGMFFCYSGSHNCYDMAKMAVKNGAVAIVCDKIYDLNVVQILVDDVRQSMATVAKNFYDTSDVKVIGITGTNGKTTTSFIIAQILQDAGYKVGVIGTNGIFYANSFLPAKLTTPDAIDLHEIFSIMKKGGVDYIVMEVSAHAIALKKVWGIKFVCKILTNVTWDHLDYFKTLDEYKKVKLSFFDNSSDLMIVNADDEIGQKIIQKFDSAISYGINSPSDCFCIDVSKEGNSFVMNICDNVLNVKTHLYGLFNVYNCISGATCCYFLGVSVDQIHKSLQTLHEAHGRFNIIKFDNKKIIIDFAHTPQGLENVLKTAQKLTDGKLICVFGCGGDRDKSKRKIMGEIAERLTDFCYITSDNPRFENPESIIDEIAQGFTSNGYIKEKNREKAIQLAINSLKSGDTLIICGKGAEKYIDIKGEKIPYSDFDTVNKILGKG